MQILPSGDPSTWGTAEIQQLIANVVQLALSLIVGIAVIFIIWGGIQYFIAFGNEEKATKGKNTLTWAIIGFVVVILAKVIVSEIWALVTGAPLNFWF
jgi:hypothetical protein